MASLTKEQQDIFWRDGCLLVEDGVTPAQLAAMRSDFAQWVEESKNHTKAYGTTLDNRPRFDVEPGHSADQPALRRVTSPTEASPAYLDVMRNAKVADCVAELIGPSIKFHHGKINSNSRGPPPW